MHNETFSAACVTGADWRSVVTALHEQLDANTPCRGPGFLYVTTPLAPYLDGILDALRETTGIRDWVGSVGSAICCTGREIYDEPAAAVLIADFPPDSYRLFPAGITALAESLERERDWLQGQAVHTGVVHGDPRDRHVVQVIDSLSSQLDPGFLVGGLSSADDDGALLQVAGGIQQGGLSGLLLSARVPVISGLTQGCTPLPNRHVITRCEGNLLAELDHRPALDVFREDIGEVMARDMSRVAGYIFAGLPVPGSDTGDYVVRNLIGIDTQEKLLAIGDNLEEDAPLVFCRRDGAAAREDMQRMLDDLARRAPVGIRGGLYFSCLGRGRHQFGEESVELRMIRDTLGAFPLAGFFANGEISHNRLYGYTGVLTLFT
jgi:small ligand-binding sensory domain FIST